MMARRKQNKEGWTLHFIEDYNFDECPYCNNSPHVHDLASAKRLYTHIGNHGDLLDGSPWSPGEKANLLEGFQHIWNPDVTSWQDDMKSYYKKPGGGWHGPYAYNDHHPHKDKSIGGIWGMIPVNRKTGRPLSTKSTKSKPKARKTKRKTTRKKTVKKKKGRKAPTISATKRKIGTRMRGNDGKMWQVKKAGKSQRWMAGAESFGAEEYCRGCGGTTLPIVDSESGYCEICHERWSDEIHSAESFETELIGNNMPSNYNPYDYVADAPFGAEEGDSCPVCGCNTLLLDNIEVEGEDFSLIVCDNCEWFEELDFEPEGVPEYEDPLEEWMEMDAEDPYADLQRDEMWKTARVVGLTVIVAGLAYFWSSKKE